METSRWWRQKSAARFIGVLPALPGLVRDPARMETVCTRAGWAPTDFIASMTRFVVHLDQTTAEATDVQPLSATIDSVAG